MANSTGAPISDRIGQKLLHQEQAGNELETCVLTYRSREVINMADRQFGEKDD